MIRNLGVFNRPFKTKHFSNNMTGMEKEDKENYTAVREFLGQNFQVGTPVDHYQFKTSRTQHYAYNPTENLENVNHALNVQRNGGTVAMLDLETFGMFKGMNANITDFDQELQAISELTVITDHFRGGGLKPDRKIDLFTFGIAPRQKPAYEKLIEKMRIEGIDSLTSTEYSTIERMSRYGIEGAVILDPKTNLYKVKKNAESSVDSLDQILKGFKTMLNVGEHQGMETSLGKAEFTKAMRQIKRADVVSGYNIKVFDLPFFNSMAIQHGLNPLKLERGQVLDLMEVIRLTDGDDMPGLMRNLAKNAQGILNYQPGYGAGRLESIAKALGLVTQSHLAEEDVKTSFEMAFYQPHFGEGNQTMLEYASEALQPVAKQYQALPSLTPQTAKKQVIYANRALKVNPNQLDFFQIDGVKQTNLDWVVNRGEYYRMKDFRYLTAEQIRQMEDKKMAQQVLEYLNGQEGLYMMNLQGASSFNKSKETFLYRSTLEEFDPVFKRFNLFNLTSKPDVLSSDLNSVSRKMVDTQTHSAIKDRVRREVSGYFVEGERQYGNMKKMYNAYWGAEQQFQEAGIPFTKKNVHSLMRGKLEGLDKNEVFQPIFGDHTATRLPVFEELYGFLKSSSEEMRPVFQTIESNISASHIKGLYADTTKINEYGVDQLTDVYRTRALNSFFDKFLFQTSSANDRNWKDGYTLMLPSFGLNGTKVAGELTQVNFQDVNSATNSIMNLTRKGTRQQATQGGQNSFQMMTMKNLVEDLVEQGILPASMAENLNLTANPFDTAKKIAAHVQGEFESLYRTMEYGTAQLSSSAFHENFAKRFNELSDALDETELGDFGDALLEQMKEHTTDRFDLNLMKVTLKNPKGKEQGKAKGFSAYSKRNRLNVVEMATEATHQAFDKDTRIFDSRNPDIFGKIEGMLQERYGYTKTNTENLKRLIYGTGGKGGMIAYGDPAKPYDPAKNMMVQLFEDNNKLYLIATEHKKANRVNAMLYESQKSGILHVEDLKQAALVVNLPMIDANYPGKTFSMGTVHKSLEHQLTARLDIDETGKKGLDQRVILEITDTIDEMLGFWRQTSGVVGEHLQKGDYVTANQIVQRKVMKPMMDAPSFTGRQTIRVNDALTTVVIPNFKDLTAESDIGFGQFYNLLPFLYDRDENVRRSLNQAYKDTRGWDPAKVSQMFKRQAQGFQQYHFNSLESENMSLAVGEYVSNNMLYQDQLIETALKYESELPAATVKTLEYLRDLPDLNQIVNEKKSQHYIMNKVNQVALVPYGVTNDISRANVNQGLTFLHYDYEAVTEKQRQALENIDIFLADRVATKEGMNFRKSLYNFKTGDFQNMESSVMGGLKGITSTEIQQALDTVLASKEDMRKRYQHLGTNFDDYFDDVMNSLKLISTFEGGGAIHPLLKETLFDLPELLSVKAKDASLTESDLDSLIGQVIDKDGRVNLNGRPMRFNYEKHVAGTITQREGNTLFIEPTRRQIYESKIMFAGTEKMVLQDPSSLLKTRNQETLELMGDIWTQIFGKTGVVANPEFLKHESSGAIVGSYLNRAFMYLQQNEADTATQQQFLDILNRNLPDWGFDIETSHRGHQVLLMNGMPNVQGKSFDGFSQMMTDFREFATQQKKNGGGFFVGMVDELDKMHKDNIYYAPLQRITNSENQADSIKVQQRASQIMGSVSGVDHHGNAISMNYTDANGKSRRYAESIIEYQDDLLHQTSRHKKGMKQLSAIETMIASANGNAEAYGIKGRILELNVTDLPILPRGVSAELMSADFYDSVAGIHDGIEVFKLNLDSFEITNSLAKEKQRFAYIPRMATEIIEGQPMMSEMQKRSNDLLQAINILQNRSSDKTQAQLLEEVNRAYDRLFFAAYDEKVAKEGILQSRVLEGRIPFSGRGLGASIIAPVTEEMKAAKTPEELSKVIDAHQVDLKQGGKNFRFADKEWDDIFRGTDKEGNLLLYDVVFLGEQQFERFGVDFEAVGKQVLEDPNLHRTKILESLKNDNMIDEAGDLIFKASNQFEVLAALEDYELDIKLEIANRKGIDINDVILNRKQRNRAKRLKGKDIERIRRARKKEEQDLLTEIGKQYLEQEGHMGTFIRDPAMKSDSMNVVNVRLKRELKGNSFYLPGYTALKMNQDNDGDTDGLSLFLEKVGIKRTHDGIKVETRLLTDETKVMQDAYAIQERVATTNATTWASDALEVERNVGKTGVREAGQLAGDDIAVYKEKIKASRLNAEGEYIDNVMLDEEKLIRANKNRHNKMAIGYISTPNYIIREMSNGVYAGQENEGIRDLISTFTAITEQDILDIKHIKKAGESLTPVESYNRGLRLLMSKGEEEQKDGLQYVINAMKGPIFKDFVPEAEDIFNKVNHATESNDRILVDGLMAIHELFQNKDAQTIFNSPYIKATTSLSGEKKLQALRDGIGETKSHLLNKKKDALEESMGMLVNGTGQSIEDDIFSYVGNKERQSYQSGFYKIKSKGVSSTDRAFVRMENIDTGESIHLRGVNFHDIADELGDSFQALSGALPDQSNLAKDFAENYLQRSMTDYSSIVGARLESEMAPSMLAYRQGGISQSELFEEINKTLTNWKDGVSEETTLEFYRRLNTRNTLELETLEGAVQDFFRSENGQALESFAQTASYMSQQGMATSQESTDMIRSFNQFIKDKAMTVEEAKVTSVHRHVRQPYDMMGGQLKRIEQEAGGIEAHFTSATSKIAITPYRPYDMRTSGANFEFELEALSRRLSQESSYSPDVIFDTLMENYYIPFVEEGQALNVNMMTSLQTFVRDQADDPSSLGWIDTDSIIRQLNHYDEEGIRGVFSTLENALIGEGNYVGVNIGSLSLTQLQGVSSSIDPSSYIGQQTKSHVDTYLNLLDEYGNDAYTESVRSRHYRPKTQLLASSSPQTGVEELNQLIRERAAKVAPAEETSSAMNGVVKNVQGSYKELASQWTTKHTIGGLAIAAVALGVLGTLSSTQLTASPKALDAQRMGREEQEYQTSTQAPRVAPSSPRSTYLNENNSMNYQISATHDGRYSSKQHADYVTQALKTSQPTRTTVNSRDNRNEISSRWLESEISELI